METKLQRHVKKIRIVSIGVSDYVERRLEALSVADLDFILRRCPFTELRRELEAEYYLGIPSRRLCDDE